MGSTGNLPWNRINILEVWNDTEYLKRYRLNREGVIIIIRARKGFSHFINKQKQPNNTDNSTILATAVQCRATRHRLSQSTVLRKLGYINKCNLDPTLSYRLHTITYNASGKYSSHFTFSTCCYVTALFQNVLHETFFLKILHTMHHNDTWKSCILRFLQKKTKQFLAKKWHVHKYSQPLPWSSNLSSGAYCSTIDPWDVSTA